VQAFVFARPTQQRVREKSISGARHSAQGSALFGQRTAQVELQILYCPRRPQSGQRVRSPQDDAPENATKRCSTKPKVLGAARHLQNPARRRFVHPRIENRHVSR